MQGRIRRRRRSPRCLPVSTSYLPAEVLCPLALARCCSRPRSRARKSAAAWSGFVGKLRRLSRAGNERLTGGSWEGGLSTAGRELVESETLTSLVPRFLISPLFSILRPPSAQLHRRTPSSPGCHGWYGPEGLLRWVGLSLPLSSYPTSLRGVERWHSSCAASYLFPTRLHSPASRFLPFLSL